ncbi:MAG TPA: carboxymuconolactone decarboxylase family protein [Trebonia sp.]|jgi:alkylhydroperoxidase/carboxymuconolactone decarboxylase family protein YurZ|nr:carboxymuconolactone decarboxylase family protein [Trebonia sp.]
MTESFERAMAVRRAVLGDEYMDRVMAKTTPLNAPFQDFVTRWVWGESWLDEALDPQSRSLVTIALVAALGQVGEVKLHTAGALRNGCQPEQIGAVLKHVAVYAGVAKAVAALNVADDEIAASLSTDGPR